MPQVDLATFFPIVFWFFVIYVGGFLFLNVTSLYSYLTAPKASTASNAGILIRAQQRNTLLGALTAYPAISL